MEKIRTITIRHYETPCGELLLGAIGSRLCLCCWKASERSLRVAERVRRMCGAEFVESHSAVIEHAVAELDEYFAGRRTDFDVPLLFIGTDFRQSLWNGLAGIPYGHKVTYGEMARRLGCPRSVRAVANAAGANPLSLFAPCHRVIGADGSLTGYAGGLEVKRALLDLEGGILSFACSDIQ